ncbi:hypothetical protein DACRYDRAFT_22473 [Dacryopinax primogenitus]|uniref:Uncharacterized protein n=1 Tax=Dacryopinax primogenitus (strain DJM 731) TaxID=1858805 RepID=M5G618_DACPD|nr:uncharacterized protein DACRYDRAFT_22473 [Dacryopinax primogenitus]EJU01262.1 hypothetical protein DACRYDRAFT_22473 [Dacryopinax primogenitus]
MLFFHRMTESKVTARLDKLKPDDIPRAVDIITKYIDSKRRRGKEDAYVVGKLERLEKRYVDNDKLYEAFRLARVRASLPSLASTVLTNWSKTQLLPPPPPDWWHSIQSLLESDSPPFVVEYPSNSDPNSLSADDPAKRPARPSRKESPPGAFLGTPASIGTIYMNGGSLTSSPAPLSINPGPPENPGPARPPNRQSIQGSTISEGTVYRYGGSVHSSYPSPDGPAQPSPQVRMDSQAVQAPGRVRTNRYPLPVEPGEGRTLASATLPLTGIPLPLTGVPMPLTGFPGPNRPSPRNTPLQPSPLADHHFKTSLTRLHRACGPMMPELLQSLLEHRHINIHPIHRTAKNVSPEQSVDRLPSTMTPTPPSVDLERRSASPNGSENSSDTILESGGSLKDEDEVPDVGDV